MSISLQLFFILFKALKFFIGIRQNAISNNKFITHFQVGVLAGNMSG